MKVLGVIPARYASMRLPGKPLVKIDGTPMVLHVLERALQVPELDRVIVATDDQRIRQVVEEVGGQVVMTSPDHISGTDRIAEAVAGYDHDLIVNIQGDEPLIPPKMISQAIAPFATTSGLAYSTLVSRPHDYREVKSPNTAKVIVDKNGYALYFSRAPIPFLREGRPDDVTLTPYLIHVGLYVYSRQGLLDFVKWKPAPAEKYEHLEQLRILYNGGRIKTVLTELSSVSVDTPEDLARVEKMMQNLGG